MPAITLRSRYNKVPVEWNGSFDALKRSAFYQHGRFMDYSVPEDIPEEEFLHKYEGVVQTRLSQFLDLAEHLPKGVKMVNVGSGVGTIDVALAQLLGQSHHYLIDRNGFTVSKDHPYYSGGDAEGHGFYNSWKPVMDAGIKARVMDRLHLLTPDDAWPAEVDVVYSSYSWCWHYGLEAYWNRALAAMKPGAYLILDVLTLAGNGIVDEISQTLRCQPKVRPYQMHANSGAAKQFGVTDSHGACYCWTNNRT